jgi:hypothetical protein
MTRQSIAEELESAADRIADISCADLQIILRRAALMLRNASKPAVFIVPTTNQLHRKAWFCSRRWTGGY